MSLFSFFNKSQDSDNSLIDIFPFGLESPIFQLADLRATYSKILTDTLERTHGIPDDVVPSLWDNCVQSESTHGLISLLVHAMIMKQDLFLVYNKATKVLRKADATETEKIRADYKATASSAIGVFISFGRYHRTDMLKIYSELEYCILASLHKTVNISRAVQVKMDSLRSSVSLADAGVAGSQAKSIAIALKAGKDVLIDAKDSIETATPNIEPTEKAILFLQSKRAYYLDLPISYLTGEQTAGIGSTGEADMRAVERGLKHYYFSIIQPTLLALYGCDTEFKSQDFRTMATALETLKTFELVGNAILSTAAQKEILARLFDIDEDEEAKALAAEVKVAPQPTAPPPFGNKPQANGAPAQ